MSEHAPPSVAAAIGGQFPVTRWTRVHVLRSDPDSAEGQRALADLCRIYWYPLYSFARRKGQPQVDAQDMVQGFFAKMLAEGSLSHHLFLRQPRLLLLTLQLEQSGSQAI